MKNVRLKYQSGFTMVELMVSLALSLLIAMAAIAALVAGRQGFNTVDAASELRDNARFAEDVIQRIAAQGGFTDYTTAATTGSNVSQYPPASVTGFNNAKPDLTDATASTSVAWQAGQVGFASDVLVLRYQSAALNSGAGTGSDGSVIDCAGNADQTAGDTQISMFYVDTDPNGSGEPALMCAYLDRTGATPTLKSKALISGVEDFQVLYGVGLGQKCKPTDPQPAAPSPNTQFQGCPGDVATIYMRADQMVPAAPTAPDPYNNWRFVRSIRIGFVLRGAVNSQPGAITQTFYPLGLTQLSATSAVGTAFGKVSDPGTIFTPAVDNRLRQVATFTVHLRNYQGL